MTSLFRQRPIVIIAGTDHNDFFRADVERMVQEARLRGVPVLLVTPEGTLTYRGDSTIQRRVGLQRAQDIGQAIRDFSSGQPVDVFIQSHGRPEGNFRWDIPDSPSHLLTYSSLFSHLPPNTASVLVAGCYSGSAMRVAADSLPPNTRLYSLVSGASQRYGWLSSVSDTLDLMLRRLDRMTPADLFITQLLHTADPDNVAIIQLLGTNRLGSPLTAYEMAAENIQLGSESTDTTNPQLVLASLARIGGSNGRQLDLARMIADRSRDRTPAYSPEVIEDLVARGIVTRQQIEEVAGAVVRGDYRTLRLGLDSAEAANLNANMFRASEISIALALEYLQYERDHGTRHPLPVGSTPSPGRSGVLELRPPL